MITSERIYKQHIKTAINNKIFAIFFLILTMHLSWFSMVMMYVVDRRSAGIDERKRINYALFTYLSYFLVNPFCLFCVFFFVKVTVVIYIL